MKTVRYVAQLAIAYRILLTAEKDDGQTASAVRLAVVVTRAVPMV